jgi:hypothetical protein
VGVGVECHRRRSVPEPVGHRLHSPSQAAGVTCAAVLPGRSSGHARRRGFFRASGSLELPAGSSSANGAFGSRFESPRVHWETLARRAHPLTADEPRVVSGRVSKTLGFEPRPP